LPFTHTLPRQLVIYTLVGLTALALDVVLFQMLIGTGLGTVSANFTSRLTAGLLGYLAHRRFTFRASWRIRDLPSFARFVTWWITCTLLGGWVLNLALGRFGEGLALAAVKVGLELLLALASFLVFRLWVFRRRRD
jgi:putative flippase GtrA